VCPLLMVLSFISSVGDTGIVFRLFSSSQSLSSVWLLLSGEISETLVEGSEVAP